MRSLTAARGRWQALPRGCDSVGPKPCPGWAPMFICVQPRLSGPMDQPSLPFTITYPTGEPGPVVLSSPHSGRVYPRAVLDRLQVDGSTLLALDDGPIDKLGQPACDAGAVLIAARYPRVV